MGIHARANMFIYMYVCGHTGERSAPHFHNTHKHSQGVYGREVRQSAAKQSDR